MPTDEEIRALCLCVLQAKNDHDFEGILGELRSALTEYFLETENLAISLILNAPKLQVVTTDKREREQEIEEEKAS